MKRDELFKSEVDKYLHTIFRKISQDADETEEYVEPLHEETVEESTPEIKPETIDVSGGWDTESFLEIIIAELNKLGLLDSNKLYRGFNTENMDEVLRTGTDHHPYERLYGYPEVEDYTWASTVWDLQDYESENAIEYALRHGGEAGLIIYNANLLDGEPGTYTYWPKKGKTFKDALVAVLELKD